VQAVYDKAIRESLLGSSKWKWASAGWLQNCVPR